MYGEECDDRRQRARAVCHQPPGQVLVRTGVHQVDNLHARVQRAAEVVAGPATQRGGRRTRQNLERGHHIVVPRLKLFELGEKLGVFGRHVAGGVHAGGEEDEHVRKRAEQLRERVAVRSRHQ